MQIFRYNKTPEVQQIFLRWYIIIRYNAIFISKSNKISVNPQIPKERFGNNRNAPFCGDTAERCPKDKMLVFAYIDWENPQLNDRAALMDIKSISNNRDGMALRILLDKLSKAPQITKMLISISDGQPRAMLDYAGKTAINDMRDLRTGAFS